MPATNGEDSLVPPMLSSKNVGVLPLKVNRPTSIPVKGSASAAMSGALRVVPIDFGTTPFWYAGWDQYTLGPPPDAPSSPLNAHSLLSSWEIPVDQPVSKSRLPVLPMPSVAPPTATAWGWIDGSRAPARA